MSEAQVEFAAKALAVHRSVRWTFVFMHQPFFEGPEYKDVLGWDKIEAALANRPHTVFAGHWHEYAKHMVNGSAYYRLATTGGDSKLSGADKGEFDEIVWVTMTKDGPMIANLDSPDLPRRRGHGADVARPRIPSQRASCDGVRHHHSTSACSRRAGEARAEERHRLPPDG